MEEVLTEYCVRHPGVETAVHCSRCDQPICPKCMISTPVGMRCKACAQLRGSPLYEVRGRPLWQAIGAAIGIVVAGGFVFSLVAGMFGRSPFIALVLYGLAGIGIAELLSLAANRKRGPRLQILAIVTTVLTLMAGSLLGLVLTGHFAVNGLSLLLVIIACVMAFNRLR